MRYKVSFEFDTDWKINGSPALWRWDNLLEDIEDEWTKIDFDSIVVYRQDWKEMTEDD